MSKGKPLTSLNWGLPIIQRISEEVILIAKATGDFNPIHLDQAYAKNRFKEGLFHGALQSDSSPVLANLPRPGSIYLSQEIKLRPRENRDTVTAKVEIYRANPEKQSKFRTTCTTRMAKWCRRNSLDHAPLDQIPPPFPHQFPHL
jgi:acyl dehydratase